MSDTLGFQTLGRRSDWRPLRVDPPIGPEGIATPALVLERAGLERNLARMCDHARTHDIGLRPHAKTHKCPVIAHRQLELGAVGICVAKVSEAEIMRAAGIERILITSPVVTPDKVSRAVSLMARSEEIMLVVDSDLGVQRLNEAALARGIRARVLIDVDPDMGRTGVPRRAEVLTRFARMVDAAEGLELCGLQHYCGQVMHIEGHAARAAASREHWQACLELHALIQADGIELPTVSGGGTGTFDIDCEIDGITDLQVGSYIFMDQEYRNVGGPDSEVFDTFEPALFVETTAISAPRAGSVTLDGGYKSFASDTVPPAAPGLAGARFYFGGDEHGILRVTGDNAPPQLGDRVRLITPHCDPTVNLYDNYVVMNHGVVEAIWPIAARGCSW